MSEKTVLPGNRVRKTHKRRAAIARRKQRFACVPRDLRAQSKPIVLCTSGDGLWSERAAEVTVTHIALEPSGRATGELRVYFTRKSWDVSKHGLIYTDKTFLRELKEALRSLGGFTERAVSGIHYSEQGMQGGVGMQMEDDYVSFDTSAAFAEEYRRRAVGELP